MQCFHGYSKPLTAGVPDLCTDIFLVAGAEIGLTGMFYSTIKYTMCCLATFVVLNWSCQDVSYSERQYRTEHEIRINSQPSTKAEI